MKWYRILYWLGSMKTEYVVEANSIEDAEKKFRKIKGNRNIIDVDEFPFRVLN